MFRLFEFGCALLQFVDALLQQLLFHLIDSGSVVCGVEVAE